MLTVLLIGSPVEKKLVKRYLFFRRNYEVAVHKKLYNLGSSPQNFLIQSNVYNPFVRFCPLRARDELYALILMYMWKISRREVL